MTGSLTEEDVRRIVREELLGHSRRVLGVVEERLASARLAQGIVTEGGDGLPAPVSEAN